MITSSCPFFQGQSWLSYSGRIVAEQMESLSLKECKFGLLNVVHTSSRIHFVSFSRNLSGIRQNFLMEYTFDFVRGNPECGYSSKPIEKCVSVELLVATLGGSLVAFNKMRMKQLAKTFCQKVKRKSVHYTV